MPETVGHAMIRVKLGSTAGLNEGLLNPAVRKYG